MDTKITGPSLKLGKPNHPRIVWFQLAAQVPFRSVFECVYLHARFVHLNPEG